MRTMLLPFFILLALLVGPYWFAGTAHAQYQYYCYTPDNLTYWSHNPCAFEGFKNRDFDRGYPYAFHQRDFDGSPLDGNSARDLDVSPHEGGANGGY